MRPLTGSPLTGEGWGGEARRRWAILWFAGLLIGASGCGERAEGVSGRTPTGYALVKQGGVLVLMSEEEKRAEEMLDSRISLAFEDEPLGKVIAAISKEKGVSVELDRSLLDEGIGNDTPITLHVNDVSLRTALDELVRLVDGWHWVENGAIILGGGTGCFEPFLRFYYVKSLLDARSAAPAPEALLGWSDAEKPGLGSRDSYDVLIALIQEYVEPDSWDAVGGPASIEKLPRWHCLLISQTEEGHHGIVELFKMLETLPGS